MNKKDWFKNPRIWIAIVLVVVIVGMLVWVIINNESLFKHKIDIYFPDGCQEVYENGKLITPECIEGRVILEKQKEEKEWYNNTITLNLTFQ